MNAQEAKTLSEQYKKDQLILLETEFPQIMLRVYNTIKERIKYNDKYISEDSIKHCIAAQCTLAFDLVYPKVKEELLKQGYKCTATPMSYLLISSAKQTTTDIFTWN